MANYTKSTNFTAKDALASGNPSKVILGSEHDAEYNAIATAISTKLDEVNSLSAETSVDYAADFIPIYDASALTNKKVLIDNVRKGVMERSRLSFFYASSGTTTNVPHNTNTNINLSVESNDIGSNFASNQYTIPTAGIYLLSGHMYITGTPAGTSTLVCYIRIDSSYYYIGNALMTAGISQTWSFSGTLLIPGSAGQTVGLTAFHNGTNNFTAAASSANRLYGMFIREVT